MKVLVIPDVHLKKWMFDKADEIMQNEQVDNVVCLMDLPDDWGKEKYINEYINTYDRAIKFANDHPKSLWCYGNHDLAYLWGKYESGFSTYAQEDVRRKLIELINILGDRIAYIHRIDHALFLHGGLSKRFVEENILDEYHQDIDTIVNTINQFKADRMWHCDYSPIWYRPQGNRTEPYQNKKLFQVVGHTPIEKVYREKNFISTDNFGTYHSGKPYGEQKFTIVDTITGEFRTV